MGVRGGGGDGRGGKRHLMGAHYVIAGLTLALMEATRTTEPPPWGIMLRAASRAVKKAPWTLMS